MKEGGRGNAYALFPNLLPLLSRIPHDSIEDLIRFYKEFFQFLREGFVLTVYFFSLYSFLYSFRIDKTISKQSECNAIVRAYMECLRFCISTTTIKDDESRKEFQNYLINNEVLLNYSICLI